MIIDSAKYSCAAGHDINEDSCLCLPEAGIFIVADGLGGHSDGEKASMTAVDYFERSCRGGYTDEEIMRLLEEANLEVLNKGDGGKTTVAAAFTENGRFIYANVGDSRVYYFRGGKIIAMTKDHSVCQASVDMGMIRQEDVRGNEDRSRLLKVLGAEETLNIKKHYQPINIQTGDAFLVCSDGFWDYVYETEMEMDLLKSDSAEVWLKYMLKRHILRAENKGDNYTAICGIIHLEEGEGFKEEPNAPKASKAPKPGSTQPGDPQRKKFFLPVMIAAAAAVIAAAVLLMIFLGKRGIGEEGGTSKAPQSTYSPSYSSKASEVSKAPQSTPPSSQASRPVSESEASSAPETISNATASEPRGTV